MTHRIRPVASAVLLFVLSVSPAPLLAQLPLALEASFGRPSYQGELGASYESGAEVTLGGAFMFGKSVGLYYEYQWVTLNCSDVLCGDEVFDTGGSGLGLMVIPLRHDRFFLSVRAGALAYHASQVGTAASGRDNSWADEKIVRGPRIKLEIGYDLGPGVSLLASAAFSDALAGRQSSFVLQAPPFGTPGAPRADRTRDISIRSWVFGVGVRIGP
jgi:hypothetical protein